MAVGGEEGGGIAERGRVGRCVLGVVVQHAGFPHLRDGEKERQTKVAGGPAREYGRSKHIATGKPAEKWR